jgi:hypothetical protein
VGSERCRLISGGGWGEFQLDFHIHRLLQGLNLSELVTNTKPLCPFQERAVS